MIVPTAAAAATAAGADVPRMALADFKKLYDASTKPTIIDVRTSDLYAAGHIPGAISIPEADVDAAYAKIPKNSLVIAYCQ